MKKNYLMILMVSIITSSTVLFPGSIHSQDLTEEQRKERCQNNKNRIAELETQLKVINDQFSNTMTQKEMKDAGNQMDFLWSSRDDTVAHDQKTRQKLISIAGIYHYDMGYCWDSVSRIDEFASKNIHPTTTGCITQLLNLIAAKIDKAKILSRPEILAKKNDIEKQLAFHRNNLVALGCDQISDTTTYDPESVAGTWNWSFAPEGQTLEKHGTVTFEKTSEHSGTMTWSGGSNGLWTQNGLTVTISWQNNPSVDNMKLSKDGHNLSGTNNKGWVVEGTRGMN